MDRRLLLTIIEKFDGGPVGLETLAAALAEERDTLEDVYEPFLIQEGFLDRTPRGRQATKRSLRAFRKDQDLISTGASAVGIEKTGLQRVKIPAGWPFAVIAAGVCAVYAGVLAGDLVCDDWPMVVQNEQLTSFRHLPSFYAGGVWRNSSLQLPGAFFPGRSFSCTCI